MSKIVQRADLPSVLSERRERGESIVFTNGCFDVLHVGHVRYLTSAAQLGDCLVVGVNGDASVKRIKGEKRPVYGIDDRLEMLAALACTTLIVEFEEDSVESLVQEVRPDILVKGGDYTEDGVVGGAFVKSYGGRVAVLDLVPGRSTTKTVEDMREGDSA